WVFFKKRIVQLDPAAASPPELRKTTMLDRILWVVLPACGSILLLATTSQMTQDIASVSFLWMIPLGLYLVTFIISFDHSRWYHRAVWIPLSMITVGVMVYLLNQDSADEEMHIGYQIGIYVAAMFCAVMICHGEMVQIKPDPSRLTGFYLAISLGGAVGGFFVNLIAPRIFAGWDFSWVINKATTWEFEVAAGYWELHVGLLLAAIATIICIARDMKAAYQPIAIGLAMGVAGLFAWNLLDFQDSDEPLRITFGLLILFLLLTLVLLTLIKRIRSFRWDAMTAVAIGVLLNVLIILLRKNAWHAMIVIVVASLLIVVISFIGRLVRSGGSLKGLVDSGMTAFAASISVMCFFLWQHVQEHGGATEVRRGFFGVLRVFEWDDWEGDTYRTLYNGRISHGQEFITGDQAGVPSTYYAYESGAGAYFEIRPTGGELAEPQQIGVVGLGVGTIAAFAGENDNVRFYEINPQVEELSRTSFFYRKQCKGTEQVVLGDARITMERELAAGQNQQFDVLFIDAFTGDSIPIHLLTLESFKLYFEHLKPDGVLAVHITNRHLDLSDPVRILARELEREATLVSYAPDDGYESDWILITKDEDFHLELDLNSWASEWWTPEPKEILWTDDYSNLFHVIIHEEKWNWVWKLMGAPAEVEEDEE
ncbi:MAG: hypothetical protein ACI8UO_001628, partial [Verrucomicrobiales bacterium]